MQDETLQAEAERAAPLRKGRKVAVVGYGSQGAAHAQNLADSGMEVRVGLRPGSPSRETARAAGLTVGDVAEAVARADVVALLIPDQVQPRVYRESVAPHLREGAALLFAHGFNVRFEAIVPPANVGVTLVAPKAPGPTLRREYREGHGVPSLVAVQQDVSGKARALALAYAHALGSARAGILETDFAEETETDLFGEQAVLCGGTAEYGDYVSGPRVVGEESREAMQQILEEVPSGAFARRWLSDSDEGGAEFGRLRDEARRHPLEEVGSRLRSRMVWMNGAEA